MPQRPEATIEVTPDFLPAARAFVRGVRGHVVCARGLHDVDSVAIWHVSAEGTLCGAWVWPWPATKLDAHRAVSLIDGRLLVDVDSEAAVELVAELFDLAGIAKPATSRKAIVRATPAWLMDEVAAFHAVLLKAYDEASASRSSKLVPLDLAPLPERLSGDLAAQMAAVGVHLPQESSPVIDQALGTATLVSWLVQLWQTAEGQRMRRSYLRDAFDNRPLSTAWLTALRQAAAQPLIKA